MPVNTPMASEEYTSFVTSAKPNARMGGMMDHTPVLIRSKPSICVPFSHIGSVGADDPGAWNYALQVYDI